MAGVTSKSSPNLKWRWIAPNALGFDGFRWVSDPKVRREVEASRRRALHRAIGRLSTFAMGEANGIVTLAKEAESESVQLRAWQAVLADQMAVSKFSDLE